ncbi:hypothetical protein NP493_218g01022 [Ridgeia piscesae]|uniref:Uncharacterized protein n=1 Tax=Ridgeia piscesae TaxID=27915 RepID=A0AAD9P0L9_RIDPI|nr:hypothetical protein NP493_218g01022 [Ridgeia piscesae]
MGLYEKLLATNKAKVSDSGGLVSPCGLSFIGRSKEKLGHIPAAIACKRIHLDNAIAMAAKQAGADLQENCSVSDVTFDDTEGLWTLALDNNDKVFKARVLVGADRGHFEAGNKAGDYN